MIDHYVDAYKGAIEPDDSYVLDSTDGDYFSQWLNEHADELVQHARDHGWSDEIDALIVEYEEAGYSSERDRTGARRSAARQRPLRQERQ